jgi:hypothetical protein
VRRIQETKSNQIPPLFQTQSADAGTQMQPFVQKIVVKTHEKKHKQKKTCNLVGKNVPKQVNSVTLNIPSPAPSKPYDTKYMADLTGKAK